MRTVIYTSYGAFIEEKRERKGNLPECSGPVYNEFDKMIRKLALIKKFLTYTQL